MPMETTTDWRTLSAGPELDAILATRVMGWTLADRRACGWGDGPPVWMTGAHPDDENASPTFQGFSPSSNIAHAARIGPALRARDNGHEFTLRIVEYPYGRTYAAFAIGEPDDAGWSEANSHEAGGESPTPLAIVRAALAAVNP